MPHPNDEQPPCLDDLLDECGEVGAHLAAIDACEGAAGNLSLYLGWPLDLQGHFPNEEVVQLPLSVPELAGKAFLVTGSGCRLRRLRDAPLANLGCLVVEPGGQCARLLSAPARRFSRITSEFNTHLAIHYAYVRRSGATFHAVVHAQPLHLTYLSHRPDCQSAEGLNRRLMRWQPEAILQLPEGLGHVPFLIPGSQELMQATAAVMQHQRLVIWAKHGVIARSEDSLSHAADYIDYMETAAHYECMNLSYGEPAPGLTHAEIRAIAETYAIKQDLF